MKTKLTPLIRQRAVEMYSSIPNVKHQDVADKLGIDKKTLLKLRKNPDFWVDVYNHYMVAFEGEIPDVLRAMIREAKHGNVQASRLIMEHSGKLQKHLNITISSPFERWLASSGQKQVEQAEIVTDELPPRTADNSANQSEEDFKKINKELKKNEWNKRRRELYEWNVRAKAVGIKPLPSRRPTKGQRAKWEQAIIDAEKVRTRA